VLIQTQKKKICSIISQKRQKNNKIKNAKMTTKNRRNGTSPPRSILVTRIEKKLARQTSLMLCIPNLILGYNSWRVGIEPVLMLQLVVKS